VPAPTTAPGRDPPGAGGTERASDGGPRRVGGSGARGDGTGRYPPAVSIPDEEVAQVRAATDLVALVSEHAALRQQGRRWVGLCPFHNEKTPSFSVNAEQGFYYCFGCQASGDAITFVRAVEHLDFADAVRLLADRAGVVLHESSEGGGDRKRSAALHDAMAQAVQWYHERLLSAPDAGRARDYLRSRGYDGDVVRRFSLGWAPDAWDALCQALRLPERVVVDSGLGFVNRAGRLQDAFRGRVLFPIFDPSGRPVAIGGRVLPGTPGASSGAQAARPEPKYKNSQETAIYVKRRTLYALNWAKHDIVATGEVVVCEGYTDVIGCFQAGIPRAVATCGTALAEEHLRLLRNFGRRIVLAYDADQAGQSAITRVYEWERRHDVDVRVAALPDGADPGDLARRDPEALSAAVAGAMPLLAFRVERTLRAGDLSTAEGRARAAEAALGAIAEHPDDMVRDQYVMQVADVTRVKPERLRDRLVRLNEVAAQQQRSGRTGGSRGDGHRSGRRDGGPGPSSAADAPDRPDGPEWGETGPQPPAGTARRPSGSRPGLEALRLAVHRPELVADRLEEVLFADDLQRRAFRALASADNVQDAVAQSDPEVADLLRRLTVEEPLVPDDSQTDPADPVVVLLVREASRRALADRQAEARLGHTALATLAGETATVRRSLEDLEDPSRRRGAADRLVAWLLTGSARAWPSEGPE
jgi:DNA primase